MCGEGCMRVYACACTCTCMCMDGMDGWNGCLGCTERRRKLSPIGFDSGRRLFLILFLFFWRGDDGGDESFMGRCGIWYMVYGIWWN